MLRKKVWWLIILPLALVASIVIGRLIGRGKDDVLPVAEWVLVTEEFHNGQSFAFSPDGKYVCYAVGADAKKLYVADREGKDRKCITVELPSCDYPVWSPDGSRIAFVSVRLVKGSSKDHEKVATLYTARRDGGNRRKLLEVEDALGPPTWSAYSGALLPLIPENFYR